MGLINTVGNLANQAGDMGTLGNDFIKSFKQQVLGIQQNPDPAGSNNDNTPETATVTHFYDLRGMPSVYRAKNSVGASIAMYGSKFQKHFSMDYDFCWNDRAYDSSFEDFQPKVQRIILAQFQPFQQTFLGQAYYTLKNAKKNGVDIKSNAIGFIGGVGHAFKNVPVLGQVGKILKNAMIHSYSKNPSILYKDDGIDIAMKDPFDAIEKMFVDGQWIHTYEIPLLNNNDYVYLHKSGHQYDGLNGGGGQLASLAKAFGGEKATKGIGEMWKAIPSTPNFKGSLQARPGLMSKFYLINKTSIDLVKNYRFLLAFSAGTYSVQMQWGALQSPNVYYVEIPGKRQMIWAQVQLEAKEIGKYRSDQYAFTQISKQAGGIYKSATLNSDKMLWPEAWQITVNISDFTPNTFNTMQHYLSNGSCLTKLTGKTRNYGEAHIKAAALLKEAQAKRNAGKN